MDTTANEVHYLRQETDALRSENRLLYNEIDNLNKTLREQIDSLRKQNMLLCAELGEHHKILEKKIALLINMYYGRHLPIYLMHLGAMQTAEWIVEHMNKLKAFDTREAHLKYALSQAGNDAVWGGGCTWSSASSRATA